MSVDVILSGAALIVTVLAAIGSAPLWIAVLLLCIVGLLPLGRRNA